ncbi:hypothetical protein K1719_044567 [Acacia pycnantha]|nr:hypothetical protein K1719_044567 [Acacia pycnantha]
MKREIQRNEGLNSSATSGTFLVNDGPYYYCVLEILLGRLSKPLYNQALKKISKFVRTNILPGAIGEEHHAQDLGEEEL